MISYYEPDILHFCESIVQQNNHEMDLQHLVELQANIKERFPDLEIMRSVPVSKTSASIDLPTLEIARCFEIVSDCFLTDTWLGKEPVEGFVGITGQTNDWNTARNLVKNTSIPVIVAGGLTPINVYGAIMATKPYGVDSCTGTNKKNTKGETVRFEKDLGLVKKFVEEVRRAEQSLYVTGSNGADQDEESTTTDIRCHDNNESNH